jgi:hypothetical protein
MPIIRSTEVMEKVGEDRCLRSCEKRTFAWRKCGKKRYTENKKEGYLDCHIFRRNCVLKHVIEEKIAGKIDGLERRGRRRKQLVDHMT